MARLNLIGLALAAAIALTSIVAGAAFALPEHLPKASWTGKNDGATLPKLQTLAGSTIECLKVTTSGKDTTDTLGEFTATFEGCSGSGVKCNSLGDASGIILMTGEYHYVYDTLATLGVAVLFLPKELHLECSALILELLKSSTANGGLLCLILEPTSSKITHLFHCEQSAGDQSETRYWNDAGTEITGVRLLCATNGGAFETCGLLMLLESTFALANLWENV